MAEEMTSNPLRKGVVEVSSDGHVAMIRVAGPGDVEAKHEDGA